jgi:hypothetical protein
MATSSTGSLLSAVRESVPFDLEFIDVLGEEDGAAVRRARDRALDRTVAVRQVTVDERSDLPPPVRDALVASALQHPNIPPVYGLAIDADGRLLVVSRLSSGRKWNEVLAEERAAADEAGAEARLRRHLETMLQV